VLFELLLLNPIYQSGILGVRLLFSLSYVFFFFFFFVPFEKTKENYYLSCSGELLLRTMRVVIIRRMLALLSCNC
jgi:hypothetical protein